MRMVRWTCNVKVKDRVPSKELRERLGIDDIILILQTSGYATWFTAGGAIRIAHYDVTDDVVTRKL